MSQEKERIRFFCLHIHHFLATYRHIGEVFSFSFRIRPTHICTYSFVFFPFIKKSKDTEKKSDLRFCSLVCFSVKFECVL